MIDRYHSQQNLSDLEESGSVHGVHPSKNRVYTSTYNVNISVNPVSKTLKLVFVDNSGLTAQPRFMYSVRKPV